MKKKLVIFTAAVLLVVLCFSLAVSRLDNGSRQHEKQLLEDALRRTAVACYAAEGFYPPNLQYMLDHYGLRYDESRYTVYYEVTASNLMPDVTVLEK